MICRSIAGLLAVLAVLPAAAKADLLTYDEGPGMVPAVRPTGPEAMNAWYWRYENANTTTSTVCFRFRRNEQPWVTPYLDSQGNNPPWISPTEPDTLPVNGCDPKRLQAGEVVFYKWGLSGLENGDRYEWCASEWVDDDVDPVGERWNERPGSLTCQTIRIDSQAPLAGLVLSDSQGRQGAVREASLRRTITYTDAVSPPWPDNRICRITDRRCVNNGEDAFDYDADCSDEPALGTSATFTCGFSWPGADARVYQCATLFDSAVADRVPDLTKPPSDDPAGPPNPDYRPAGSGNFAIACDTILIDRQAPRLTLRSTPRTASVGTAVTFDLSAGIPEPGGAGITGAPAWDFGDGSQTHHVVEQPTATGAAVSHVFTRPGDFPVTATWADAAGNVGSASIVVAITYADPAPSLSLNAARQVQIVPRGRTYVAMDVVTKLAGTVEIAIVRGKRTTVGAGTRRFTLPGQRRFRIPLERPVKPGVYEIRVSLISPGGGTITSRTRSVRLVNRLTRARQ